MTSVPRPGTLTAGPCKRGVPAVQSSRAGDAFKEKDMAKRKIKFVAVGNKWFDKVNGNTYHSVQVTRCSDGAVLRCPFTYGYGNQYQQSALEAMIEAGWIPKKYGERLPSGVMAHYQYGRENGYPIMWIVYSTLKRTAKAHGAE